MTESRQPTISTTRRVIAGMCAVIWLLGPLSCGAVRISACVGHDQASAGQASPDHDDDILGAHEDEQSQGAAQDHHHEDGEAQHGHSSKGKKPCDEEICCSTMQALLPTAKPIIIASPLSQQLIVVCLLNAASQQALAASNCDSIRQAKPRDGVLTPLVCLGPAHRSLAPPSPAVG